MPSYTDNHELQLFDEGETPWDHGPDMETLDTAVSLKRDRAPDESQEEPKDGAMFLDTSEGEIYVGDGDSWGDPEWDLADVPSGGGSAVASPDINRIFVRDTDPADEFDITNRDLWVDTSDN